MINGVGKQQQQGSARKKWSHVSDLFLILALFFYEILDNVTSLDLEQLFQSNHLQEMFDEAANKDI